MNLQSVAELCGVSVVTIRRIAERGELPSIRLGRRLLFHPEDVHVFLNNSRETDKSSVSDGTQLLDANSESNEPIRRCLHFRRLRDVVRCVKRHQPSNKDLAMNFHPEQSEVVQRALERADDAEDELDRMLFSGQYAAMDNPEAVGTMFSALNERRRVRAAIRDRFVSRDIDRIRRKVMPEGELEAHDATS